MVLTSPFNHLLIQISLFKGSFLCNNYLHYHIQIFFDNLCIIVSVFNGRFVTDCLGYDKLMSRKKMLTETGLVYKIQYSYIFSGPPCCIIIYEPI